MDLWEGVRVSASNFSGEGDVVHRRREFGTVEVSLFSLARR
jgi:hypothetical protein